MLTKHYGTIYALLKTPEAISNKERLESLEYFRFSMHGSNVRVRELGESYTSKNIKIKDPISVPSVQAVIQKEQIHILNKINFFETLADARSQCAKAQKKFPDAFILPVEVITNMTQREYKKRLEEFEALDNCWIRNTSKEVYDALIAKGYKP